VFLHRRLATSLYGASAGGDIVPCHYIQLVTLCRRVVDYVRYLLSRPPRMPRGATNRAQHEVQTPVAPISLPSQRRATSPSIVELPEAHVRVFDTLSCREGCEATPPPLIIGLEVVLFSQGVRLHGDHVDRLRAARLPLNVTVAGKRYALCGIVETNTAHFRARIPVLHGQPETYGPPGVYEVDALRESLGISLLQRLSPNDVNIPFDSEDDQYSPCLILYGRCS